MNPFLSGRDEDWEVTLACMPGCAADVDADDAVLADEDWALELLDWLELTAAEQAALTIKANTVTMAQRTIPAIAIPRPRFLPFFTPLKPMMDKTSPMIASSGEPRFITGRGMVTSATMPNTMPATASPESGFVVGAGSPTCW